MKLLDLFTGTGSVAKVARDLGYEVTTLDIDARCNPDICADVLEFDYTIWEPGQFDIVWASPPCDYFSCARRCNIGRHVRGELMTAESVLRDVESLGLPVLRRCQEIIEYLQPATYFIENPYTGTMKNYIDSKPYIFDYCMFGLGYRKRTAIWSNKILKNKMCDRSHLQFGRHAMTAIGTSKTQTGQGGGNSKKGRYHIPEALLGYVLGVEPAVDIQD